MTSGGDTEEFSSIYPQFHLPCTFCLGLFFPAQLMGLNAGYAGVHWLYVHGVQGALLLCFVDAECLLFHSQLGTCVLDNTPS